MTLRIGSPQPPLAAPTGPPTLPTPQDLAALQGPVPEDAPPDADAQDPEGDRAGAKVSPDVARYFGPEGRCKNCTHYLEGQTGGECDIVAGPIDPEGSCSLFTPDADQLGGDESEGPDVSGAPAPPSAIGPPGPQVP